MPGICLYGDSLVSSLVEMTSSFKHCVKALRVGALEPPHPFYEIWFGRFHQKMIVVAHQHKGMNVPPCLGTHFVQGCQKEPSSIIRTEDFLAIIPSAHRMVVCSLILDADGSRHVSCIKNIQETGHLKMI